MKKLNNKGLSIIELLICFVIVSVIAISLLNIIMNYKSMQETEHIKNLVKTYNDQITKLLQNDIIKYTLKDVSIDRSVADTLKLTLHFKHSLDGNYTEKELVIVAKDNENYIEYPDIVKDSSDNYIYQVVRYDLPSTSKISKYNSNKSVNDIHFAYLPGEDEFIVNGVFTLKIPIEHSELSSTYEIKIISPVTTY